jgi:hypothetical protein
MTTLTGQRPEGLERHLRPSGRAVMLAVWSRIALAALALTAVSIVGLSLWNPLTAVSAESTPAASPHEVVDPSAAPSSHGAGDVRGVTTAELLAAVEQETRGVGARIVDLEMKPAAGLSAEVRVRVQTPDGDAPSVARVVSALWRAGLESTNVRTVTSLPVGARLEVTGVIERATSPLSAPSQMGVAVTPSDPSVALTALVQQSGAVLRRLEVIEGAGPSTDRTIRIVARAGASELVDMLAALEREQTAPMRFTTWRVEAVGDELELAATFGRRSAATVSGGTVAP